MRRLREARAKMLGELTAEQRKRLAIPDDVMEDIFRIMLTPWFRYFAAYDRRATLKRVRVPVLAVVGERDLQVTPAKEHLSAVAESLRAGGNRDVTTILLPGLNHLLQTSRTGSPAEYGTIEETISPVALDLIADWILKRTAKT